MGWGQRPLAVSGAAVLSLLPLCGFPSGLAVVRRTDDLPLAAAAAARLAAAAGRPLARLACGGPPVLPFPLLPLPSWLRRRGGCWLAAARRFSSCGCCRCPSGLHSPVGGGQSTGAAAGLVGLQRPCGLSFSAAAAAWLAAAAGRPTVSEDNEENAFPCFP